MKIKTFNILKNFITNWAPECIDARLMIQEDLSTLTPLQWKTLEAVIINNENIKHLELYNASTYKFSEKAWQRLLAIVKKSKIESFIISKDDLHLYTDSQLNILFNILKDTSLNKFGIHIGNFNSVHSIMYSSFIKNIADSDIKTLDLSGNFFSQTQKDLIELFFDNIINCPNLRMLCLGNDFPLGPAATQFWEVIADKVNNIQHIEQLVLDGTTLYEIPELEWLNFCKNLKLSSIKSLSLRNNRFYNFNAEQWRWFFKGLSEAETTELNIHEYHSMELVPQKWQVFCAGLKSTSIITLHYQKTQFDEEQRKSIQAILKRNEEKNYSNAKQSLKNNFNHDEKENISPFLNIYENKKIADKSLKRKRPEEIIKKHDNTNKRKRVMNTIL